MEIRATDFINRMSFFRYPIFFCLMSGKKVFSVLILDVKGENIS